MTAVQSGSSPVDPFIAEELSPEALDFQEPAYGKTEFNFTDRAAKIAHQLQQTRGAFTLGVFGDWGSGKTTFCNLIGSHLETMASGIVWVRFNAWRSEDRESPILHLLETIQDRIETKRRVVGKAIRNGFKGLIYGTKPSLEINLPGTGKVKLETDLGKAIDREAQLNARFTDQMPFATSFRKLSQAMQQSKKVKLVVFVDDLDRCTPARAIKLLEQIKLILDLPNTIIILALNKRLFDD
ncbi:KAP NTPase domain-containing protein [Sulfidibacter corallicola]|uniref:KAP NTPase domain-containing protein n=1 Tax=Sulfidibacter corallicola TaxID=2818388 RepID=A0A8A4TS64_SULCO|nr:P-loop NTPase fold protein [Sulfidibacter corallicola]QTD51902.1 hypothetical protein J3U87_05470 [Sulfidibacter corallicola]